MDFQTDLENYSLDESKNENIHKYSVSDSVFALIMFLFGYLFVNWVLFVPDAIGLGATVLVVAFSVISIIYLKLKGIHLKPTDIAGIVGIDLVSLSYFLYANDTVKGLVTLFIIFAFSYWFYCAAENREEKVMGDMLIFDLLKSVLILPFASFGKIFGAAKNGIKSSSVGKKIGMILIGIFIAIVPTLIITVLLLNADDAFANLTDNLFSDMFTDLPKHIWHFVLGIPVAMYVFGMMYSNSEHRCKEYMSREKNENTMARARIAPAIITCAAITPIIIVYLLFFFSQTGYFLSAFSGIRPEGITYAEYARRGFFELCTVSVINLVIILFALLLSKREKQRISGAVRGYVITLSASTLILISIAISKMVMYIDAYGLTRRRVYTTWFMIALAVLFVFIIIRQITSRFNLFRSFAAVAVAMFVIMVFADVDAVIAKYNVQWYQTGKLKTVDIDAMYDLSDSAVKYVVPLVDDDTPAVSNAAKDYVSQKKRELDNRDNEFANFNLTTYYAAKSVGADTEKE